MKHASPKPNRNEHSNATDANGGLKKPMDFVSWNGESSGKFKNIKRKLIKCTIQPAITIGSRPYFTVFDPNKPNNMPPKTSPIPMHIPDKPTKRLADSPIANVKPILELYTPLKKDNSKPENGFNLKKKKIV